MTAAVLASIPSPSFNTIDIWPRPLTLYGLMIGLGIIAATILARPRMAARRIHPDTVIEILVWLVPAGIIGARLYHVLTDFILGDSQSSSAWYEIWEGGLGIPGGIAGGAIGALLFIRIRDLPRAEVLDALVPAVPLAQAIGRWGNWWNQELYGRQTDLPWGLEIDDEHRPASLELDGVDTLFHPTFLYECLWNLGLVLFLLWVDRRGFLRPGKLIWVYTAGYAIGRLWIELLRIDTATEILGVRVNVWLMLIVLVLSVFMLRDARAEGDHAGTGRAVDTDTGSDGGDAGDDHEDDADQDHADQDDDRQSTAKGGRSAKGSAKKAGAKKAGAKSSRPRPRPRPAKVGAAAGAAAAGEVDDDYAEDAPADSADGGEEE
ncbi:MAG: prolipoprotein diacylglyceryl transferase [Actinomycetota bacterium]